MAILEICMCAFFFFFFWPQLTAQINEWSNSILLLVRFSSHPFTAFWNSCKNMFRENK